MSQQRKQMPSSCRALTPVLLSTHLTDDEHVLPLDDTLLHLGLQSLTNVGFIPVHVSGVYVAVAGRNGGLHRTLDGGPRMLGGLQQGKYFFKYNMVKMEHTLLL